MKTYGLIGKSLSHSFSKEYFTTKFDEQNINAQYQNFELANIDGITQLTENNEALAGLNVTIPYKQEVIPYLHELTSEAAEIGAVNTIQFIDGKRIGHNTDCYGFSKSLQNLLSKAKVEIASIKALVLGTGGAAQAIKYSLKQIDIEFQSVSRIQKEDCLTYSDIDESILTNHQLIINTTPLGTHPNIDEKPSLPYDVITSNHILFDLVYNPSATTFLKEGKQRNALIQNGQEMLELQAEKAWEIWNK